MGDFYQYYYALGESDDAAVHRVRDTVRFLMGCTEAADTSVRAGGAVAEADVDALMEWALAHKDTQHDELDWSEYSGPRDGVIPMLGYDWGTSGTYASQPRCRHCGADVDIDGEDDGWFQWLEDGTEPQATCEGDGHTGLVGDFDMRTTLFFRTNCGVALQNWPNLEEHGPGVHEQVLRLIGHRPMYTIRKS
ncbi:hypothetical protein [Nocardia sp. NPDC057668]|uniref:hypothetical protein n=1 Tax=Nocardia sp. NPDC057668 TaxID=3346202 RepID=UPI00366E79F4